MEKETILKIFKKNDWNIEIETCFEILAYKENSEVNIYFHTRKLNVVGFKINKKITNPVNDFEINKFLDNLFFNSIIKSKFEEFYDSL